MHAGVGRIAALSARSLSACRGQQSTIQQSGGGVPTYPCRWLLQVYNVVYLAQSVGCVSAGCCSPTAFWYLCPSARRKNRRGRISSDCYGPTTIECARLRERRARAFVLVFSTYLPRFDFPEFPSGVDSPAGCQLCTNASVNSHAAGDTLLFTTNSNESLVAQRATPPSSDHRPDSGHGLDDVGVPRGRAQSPAAGSRAKKEGRGDIQVELGLRDARPVLPRGRGRVRHEGCRGGCRGDAVGLVSVTS